MSNKGKKIILLVHGSCLSCLLNWGLWSLSIWPPLL